MAKDKLFVHIRDIKTRDVIESVEFTGPLTQRNLDQLETAILKRLDLDTQFIDSVAVSMTIQRKRR